VCGPGVESSGPLTPKADVFSFAGILSRIVADDRPGGAVPPFLPSLIEAGLSQDPSNCDSFGAILSRLETDGFEIGEGVDSEAVSAFVRAAEP
jgi:hypothetical protein